MNMTKDTTNNVWPYEIEITGSGWSATHTFPTENKFVDANIVVKAHANAAGSLSLNLTDNSSSDVTIGTASSGKYPLTANLAGTITPASAGWIAASAQNVSENGVVVGTITQSTLKNGTTAINSGTTVNPGTSSQTINIGAGLYDSARSVVIGPASAGPKGVITSGAGTISSVTFAEGSNTNSFNISGSGTVAAPTVGTAGYVSSDSDTSIGGTKNTNTATLSATVDKIIVGASVSGTTSLSHSLSKGAVGTNEGWTNAASSSSAVTSTPDSGVYVKVNAGALSTTITSQGTVATAGYGTTTKYGTSTAVSTVVSASAASIFVPIQEAGTFSASIGSVTSSNIAVGSKSNGYYPITSDLSIPATLSASTNGWFSSGTATGTKSSVTIGSLPEAEFSPNGNAYVCVTAGYVPLNFSTGSGGSISNATLANSATSGTSYTDISNDAPVLVSGSGLYINAGYIGNTYISLAKLVPDSATKPSGASGYAGGLLSGYALYDETGALVSGSIQTYDGSFTVT